MIKVIALLEALERHIPNAEMLNPAVSKANVGWQIDHSLKVINSVAVALQKSNPKEYHRSFTLKKSYFLLVKRIPRGKVRAPKAVQSYEEITTADIKRQLQTARALLNEANQLDRNSHFTHPFLGQFNLKEAGLFLQLHTRHHLDIIRDIIKKS